MSTLPPSASVLFGRLASRARLRHLQLLVRISELGHLNKAAQSIGMSQPAATHALAEIEMLLGISLFERHARGMRPTPIGQALLPQIRESLASLLEGMQIVASQGAGIRKALRVGSIGAGISGLLQKVLPTFSDAHRHVSIDIVQQRPDELLMACLRGTIELAICREPAILPPGFVFRELMADRYAVVCASSHRLAGETEVTLETLSQQCWLMPPSGTIADRDFTEFWQAFGRIPDIRWVTGRAPMLVLAMLRAGDLLLFSPFSFVSQWIEAGILREIPGRWGAPLPSLGAMYQAETYKSHDSLQAFVGALAVASR